jgi:hypothetical protein
MNAPFINAKQQAGKKLMGGWEIKVLRQHKRLLHFMV